MDRCADGEKMRGAASVADGSKSGFAAAIVMGGGTYERVTGDLLKIGFNFIFLLFNSSWLPSVSGGLDSLSSDERLHDAVVAVHHFIRCCGVLVAFSFVFACITAMFWVGTQTMCPAVKHFYTIVE